MKPYHNCGGISRIPLPYATCNQGFSVWRLVLVDFFWCCFNVWMAVSHDAFLILAAPSRTSATKSVSRSFLARIVWRWIDSTCGKRCLCWLFHVYLWRSVVDAFSLCTQLRFIHFYIYICTHSVFTYVSVTLEYRCDSSQFYNILKCNKNKTTAQLCYPPILAFVSSQSRETLVVYPIIHRVFYIAGIPICLKPQ